MADLIQTTTAIQIPQPLPSGDAFDIELRDLLIPWVGVVSLQSHLSSTG